MSVSMFGFSVSNTNGNARQRSCVRVYNSENELIAEQFINKHNPLQYIRDWNGKHRAELKSQCLARDMTEIEFEAIF